jgi:hypothetical protein
VYRIDEKHRATVDVYSASPEWNEGDARVDVEDFIRYFYTRDRETIGSPIWGFPRSLWYLAAPLAARAKQASQAVNKGACIDAGEACTVASYLADGSAPDVSITIEQTSIEAFRPTGQWKAVVVFRKNLTEKLGKANRSIVCTASIIAEYLDVVPAEYLPSSRNPRGLLISSSKVAQGYAE